MKTQSDKKSKKVAFVQNIHLVMTKKVAQNIHDVMTKKIHFLYKTHANIRFSITRRKNPEKNA